MKKFDVFNLSRDYRVEMSRDSLGGAPSSLVSTLPGFWAMGLLNITFLICHITTWSMCHVNFTIDAVLLPATYSWFWAILLAFSSMHFSIKKVFFFARSPYCVQLLTCFAWEGHSHRRLFFPDCFTRDKNGFQGLFSNEFRYSCAINKFRSGTIHRIFSYWTKHLKVPGNCR